MGLFDGFLIESICCLCCLLCSQFWWNTAREGQFLPSGFQRVLQTCVLSLQKIKLSSAFPVLEKWEAYTLPKHACLAAIEDGHFSQGTRVPSAFEKVKSTFLRTSSTKTAVASWRPNWVRFSPRLAQLKLSSRLGKDPAAFVRNLSLDVMATQPFTFLAIARRTSGT